MTTPQLLALGVIGLMMAVFIWDRIRYDVVACGALALSVILGIVPAEKAFSGFSDDIVIIVGSALVVSYGVARSGIVDLTIKRFFPNLQTVHAQLALLVLSVAVLSAFIKNIGALAIMMPAAFQFARKSGKSPSLYLMPMSFGALLGGLMTQIGTSPNIVVSRLRHELTGESFTMFDFTPVGAALTVVGAVFLIFFHWILPERRNENPSIEESLDNKIYSTEATVTEDSPIKGKALSELLQYGDREIVATAVIRGHTRMTPFPDLLMHTGDTIILEGSPNNLDRAVLGAKLKLQGSRALVKDRADLISIEAVVTRESSLVGLSARQLSLSNRRNVNLLAVSRQGHRLSERLSELVLQEGDVIVLQGSRATLPSVLQDFACLPLAQRDIMLGASRRAYLPVIILAAAMGATAIGVASVPVAFFCSALAMVIFGVIPLADVYKAFDGPILIMLAALIPVADTLRTSGASEILAHHLGEIAHTMPSWGALTLILVTAMAVTPFLNNAATVLVMAPIAASFATTLGYKPEAFLMAVAIGAGCDFLTPIGHQCNTLVMGPGGYRFSDYPRLGLPLSFIVIVVSVPMLLWVWPVS